jgi:pilus assembly protein CpaC
MNSAGPFLRAMGTLAGIIAIWAILLPGSGLAETINVTLHKTQALKISRAAATILVGKAEIADVSVESRRLIFLTGKSAGETNLLIYDGTGNEILNADLVVAPEGRRHVTIYRSTEDMATLSCDPRCTRVPNPDVLEERAAAPTSDAGGAEQAAAGGDGGQAAAGASGAAAATATGAAKK